MMGFILIVIAIINLISLCLVGIDKKRAIQGKYRISERTLLLSGAIFGGYGFLIGMQLFNHKTRKLKFILLSQLFIILQTAIIILILIHPDVFDRIYQPFH